MPSRKIRDALRILIIVNEFPPDVIAGTSLSTANLAKHLARRGHTVQVLVTDRTISAPKQIWKDIVFIIIGCVALYFGSEWFVNSAKDLALSLGVEERVVGLTIVALGTSLPELTTAAVASYKGQTDLAIGNLMGSNIFNILSILGITSLIHEIPVHVDIVNKDIIWMLLVTLVILPLMITRRRVGRMDGIILITVYVIYIYTVVV
jgi:cation:H+ antiporter